MEDAIGEVKEEESEEQRPHFFIKTVSILSPLIRRSNGRCDQTSKRRRK